MSIIEEVNGTIIGAYLFPYEFWIDERPSWALRNVKRKVARGYFEDDEQAIEWFRVNFPAEYAIGVEMRVWDK